jgi:hypothetical protein
MNAQLRSQGDYERALKDFEQTGRTSEIREISLRDDGVAGERYDAESQLTITVEAAEDGYEFTVATATLPVMSNAVAGAVVVRVPANSYQEQEAGGLPGMARYCPEQAWVFLGAVGAPAIRRVEGADVEVVVPRTAGAAGAAGLPAGRAARSLMVKISGNAGLVEQVLMKADWAVLRAVAEG